MSIMEYTTTDKNNEKKMIPPQSLQPTATDSQTVSHSDAEVLKAVKKIHKSLHKTNNKIDKYKDSTMTNFQAAVPSYVATGSGGMDGLGMGGGLVGGLLLGALLRNGGLLGGDGATAVTPAFVTSTVNEATNNLQHSLNMTQVADIKASIPLMESQNQLSQAQNTASIIAQTNQLSSQNDNQFALTNKGISDAIASGIAVANQNREVTQATANSTQVQGLQNKFEIVQAINADGAATRALIVAQNDATLNRIITTQAAELAELRGDARATSAARGVEVSVNNNANAIAVQSQQQAQQQQQTQLLAALVPAVNSLIQQNQNIHQGIVNLGTMNGNNSQTAANTRVN